MHPIFVKKDTYLKHFCIICLANYEDVFFYSFIVYFPYQQTYKYILYLLTKLSTL